MTKKKITLIGAGPTGALLAIFLSKHGFEVELFERRPDMRKGTVSGGRSINLALSVRGLHALREAGLFERIMQIAVPMKGRMMHALNGDLTFQRYGKDDSEVIYAVLRSSLNEMLLTAAEQHESVRMHFNQRCSGIDLKTGVLELRDETTGAHHTHPTEVVLGTDGSASAIRMEMLKSGRFNFSQQYLAHGYKELLIPPGRGGAYQMEKHALHIWPRQTYMLIALPNVDGSFAGIFFFQHEGEPSFTSLTNEAQVLQFFQEQFGDVVPLMPNLGETYFANPLGAMVTIKCDPWHVGDRVLLMGDAAHAIVPFFGQGVNCCFEDCTYFNQCLEQHGDNWGAIFAEFERLRKPNTDAIAELALENFIEMRDHVADPKFLLKKKVERALEEKFPEWFTPKYSLVTFRRGPYAEAWAQGQTQDHILEMLCASLERVEDLNWETAERLLRRGM